LVDEPEVVRQKTWKMITDRTRIKRTDPGHPENCDVCQLHRYLLTKAEADELDQDCRTARIGCVDRKKALAESILQRYGAIAERSRSFRAEPERVIDVIKTGSAKAREEAARTMDEVRRALRIAY